MENLETMEYYILQTHDLLEKNVQDFSITDKIVNLFKEREYKAIKIVASGSSGNAGWCAKYDMERILGIPVSVISPFTFANYPQVNEDDFIFVISQSGYSKNALDALDCLKEMNHLAIALTGDVNSDIKDHCDVLIEYGVGEEKEGYVTKGVTSLVLFLKMFALRIVNDQLAYDALTEYCKGYSKMQKENFNREENFMALHEKKLLSMNNCYVVGCGIAEGVAKEAALKIGETVKIVSCGYELEEYIHGPNLQLSPNHNVFIIDAQDHTSDRSYQIYRATRAVSDRVYYVTNKEYEDDHVLTLLNPAADTVALSTLQFFQLLAYRISKELRTIPKHPLMKKFNEIVNSKTIVYEDD